MLDTGMLAAYYSERPAALVIEGDAIEAYYLAPSESSTVERGPIEAYGLTEAQLLVALTDGRIEIASGGNAAAGSVRAVMLMHDGRDLRAEFIPDDRRGRAAHELAAHALDRLLGLYLVPPTVAREIEGERGALRLVYPDALSESERLEQGLPLGTWCAIEPQVGLMQAFDLLTYNVGRTADSILFRRDLSTLKLTTHQGAFGTERLTALADGAISLPAPLAATLAAVDDETLEAVLGDWLSGRQIRALAARRDALLERAAVD
jgi:hypothetical protein